ncbi:MAG: nucleoside-diphosphate kinase [Myxococcota bacterium]|nr:nucleoside-diphosphate kinase [Myxococcota bacterium]
MTERTLSIVKPDAVAAGHLGEILAALEHSGLKIVAGKMVHLTPTQAAAFYAVHDGKPFFERLVAFMSSGPCFVNVLEGDNAILRNRTLMGATNPEEADEGTLRKRFAESMSRNAVHGSDSPESAATEIAHFFQDADIVSYERVR